MSFLFLLFHCDVYSSVAFDIVSAKEIREGNESRDYGKGGVFTVGETDEVSVSLLIETEGMKTKMYGEHGDSRSGHRAHIRLGWGHNIAYTDRHHEPFHISKK